MNIKANLFLKATLLILACVLPASTALAQTDEQLNQEIETVSINTRLVNVTVTATDAKGRPLAFDASALKLYADGVRQEAAYVHSQDSATNVVLLVDISGSMRGRVAQETRFLVQQFLKAADPNNRYNLFVFSNGARKVGEFAGDKEGQRALLKALENQKYGGATALYSSTRQTLKDLLAAKPTMKSALVIFTDGMDTASPAAQELAADLDSFGGYSVAFIIGPSMSFNPLERDLLGPASGSNLKEVAERLKRTIGGEAYIARGWESDIEKVAKRVALVIQSSVELGFYPQDGAAQPGAHNLRIEAAAGNQLNLRARVRYIIEK